MRPIEFRGWDTDKKTMHYDITGFEGNNGVMDGIFVDGDFRSIIRGEIIPMQFTGLIDGTGKKVYEGDVLNIWYSDIGRVKTEQVVYRNASACFDTPDVEDWHRANFDVIGNIYEDPELCALLSNPDWVEPENVSLVLTINRGDE